MTKNKLIFEIEPNPYSSESDYFLTDNRFEAKKAILEAAGDAWDSCEEGGENTVKIRVKKSED